MHMHTHMHTHYLHTHTQTHTHAHTQAETRRVEMLQHGPADRMPVITSIHLTKIFPALGRSSPKVSSKCRFSPHVWLLLQ